MDAVLDFQSLPKAYVGSGFISEWCESNKAINWLSNNNMIVNPNKFQAIDVSKATPDVQNLVLDGNTITSSDHVKLLGVSIDNRLSFTSHVSNCCRQASAQLNALFRLGSALNFKQKKALIDSFITANFSYCPLVWHFCSAKSSQKIESIFKRSLHFLFSDFNSSYEELLVKANRPSMNVYRLRVLCMEIYKTINNMNPSFMSDIFIKNSSERNQRSFNQNNLDHYRANQVRFGQKSIKALGPRIWNCLPASIKNAENFETFTKLIKNWNFPACNCNFCVP